jgi:hypothetical protein
VLRASVSACFVKVCCMVLVERGALQNGVVQVKCFVDLHPVAFSTPCMLTCLHHRLRRAGCVFCCCLRHLFLRRLTIAADLAVHSPVLSAP